MLPARIDELERVRLLIELRRAEHVVNQLRQLLTEEEAEQLDLQRRVEQRVGRLRAEVERLQREADRLELRLAQLATARRPLTDEELDREEDEPRAGDAAWWAGWRERHAARDDLSDGPRLPSDQAITVRQLYRALARLVHPDLARDARDREQRERVMRIANAAKESLDADQLRSLLAIWAATRDHDDPWDVDALRARVADERSRVAELKRQLSQLRRSSLGLLLRRGDEEIASYLRNEERRLSQELAVQRLRRRRLLRLLEERRRSLSVSAGE